MKIILASASLGRRKLLESLGIKFEVMEPNVDEEKIVDRDPVKMAIARAVAKAQNVYDLIRKNEKILIIGADTVGFMDDWVFNKPKSREEAEEMLARLSGKTHKYVSAHSIIKFKLENNNLISNIQLPRPTSNFQPLTSKHGLDFEYITDYDISSVTFRRLTPTDISFYLDRVDYLKLCGGLKIMNSPQNFVTATTGSISNIIGLSLEKLILVLKCFISNLAVEGN